MAKATAISRFTGNAKNEKDALTMKVTDYKYDCVYEVQFLEPSFRVVESNLEILRTFFETINPRFPISPANIGSRGGNTLSDLLLTIQLFGGAGRIELTVDKLVARFNNVGSKDQAIIVETISLAEKALERAEIGSNRTSTIVNLDYSFDISEEDISLTEKLNALVTVNEPDDFEDLKGYEINNSLTREIISADEGWSCYFRFGAINLVQEKAFANFNFRFENNSIFQTVEDRESLIVKIQAALLEPIGMEK